MRCEVTACDKEVKNGSLIYREAYKRMPNGQPAVKISLFVVVCDECIAKYEGQSQIRGSIRIVDEEPLFVGEGI